MQGSHSWAAFLWALSGKLRHFLDFSGLSVPWRYGTEPAERGVNGIGGDELFVVSGRVRRWGHSRYLARRMVQGGELPVSTETMNDCRIWEHIFHGREEKQWVC